jgi:hypothetical protein
MNLAGGALHDPGEDGALVRHQKGGEGDGKDQAEVFGAIARSICTATKFIGITPLLNDS